MSGFTALTLADGTTAVDDTHPLATKSATGSANPLTPSTAVSGQAKIAVTGTAVQLATVATVNGIVVKANSTNGGALSVGGVGVNNVRDGTGNGYVLLAGEAASFAVPNSNVIWINGTAGDWVSFEGN